MKQYPILTFFILSFSISWFFWIPLVYLVTEFTFVAQLGLIIGGLGPFLAALLVTWCSDGGMGVKTFLRSIVTFKYRLIWYVFALFLPMAIFFIAYGLLLMINGVPGHFETPPVYFYPLALIFTTLLGGGLEEPGWRGFALPRLLAKMRPLTASFILGIFWAFWHLPLFYIPIALQGNIPFVWYVLNTIGLSIIFTWFYKKTQGSILLAVILHGSINAPSGWAPPELLEQYAILTLTTWLVAVVLVLYDHTKGSEGKQ